MNSSILVVDDDSSTRAMLGLTLRQAGYYVKTASGGEEALQCLEKEPFEWLITDARMMPLDGFQLSVRAKKLNPCLRILMVSAVNGENDIENYPIETVFSKPVPTDQLLAWLSGSQ